MDTRRKELQEIITDIRAHLEFQQALGVKTIEVGSGVAEQPSLPKAAAVPSAPPAVEVRKAAPAVQAPAARTTFTTLEEVRAEMGDCCRCKLHKGRKTIVFGEGDPAASLVFVGEGPGFEEDQQGRPFVGAAGELLTKIIENAMGIKRPDVYICNIVKCRPPGNRTPEPDEVDACIGFVKQQIAVIKPKVIVTLGNVPTQNLLNTKQGITKIRGTWQEYDGIPVMPTFHPSYLLRSPGEKKWVWVDIKKVMEKLGMTVPTKG